MRAICDFQGGDGLLPPFAFLRFNESAPKTSAQRAKTPPRLLHCHCVASEHTSHKNALSPSVDKSEKLIQFASLKLKAVTRHTASSS